MVGDGPLRAECQAIVDAAALGKVVWFAGERPDVPDVMRGLDCFVLPSLVEGISNTILEAMASGLPIVATRVGGTPDLVDEGRTGHLVPPGDAESLASALARMALDTGGAREMGQAGRDKVKRCFSLKGMVSAYEHVYRSVLGCGANQSGAS